ncbi:MAG: four helix bundle suffix domain-containing protein [Paludibacteraceae bacterium]|nr:four helix bundle suffix domain-containing protein [Paludibacteraceae bacterium]
MEYNTRNTVLRRPANWRNLYFYQKADALFQMTVIFCERFLPEHGDRTVDQMVQAARSGKQNIVEGSEDGMTSTQMEINLLNVARASIQELQRDYNDYLNRKNLLLWDKTHARYQDMLAFCRQHNTFDEYKELINKINNEEFCNLALTLCHMVDKMMSTYLHQLEEQFVKEGGIKERMHAARTGYRQAEMERLAFLEREVLRLQNILTANGIEY